MAELGESADDAPAGWAGVAVRVRRVPGELLTIASLNTRGIPLTGSRLTERYAAIGAGFDAGDADVVCCQEVFTYWHLRVLVRRMRWLRSVRRLGQARWVRRA